MEPQYDKFLDFFAELNAFLTDLKKFVTRYLYKHFSRLESGKGIFVTFLYRQRGKFSRFFVHSGMAGLATVGVVFAPVIAQEFPGRAIDPWDFPSSASVLSATTEDPETSTLVSDKVRDKVIEYPVKEGDTVSSIAEKFGVSTDTIRWQNDLKSKDSIKTGQVLKILPVTGVLHKVQKGDTIFSISKKYDAGAQAIVDFPYNTFVNDETFELAIGQEILVPDGVKPAEIPWSPVARVRQITPDAGTVVASGVFVWPAGGTITQRFAWYHKGIDIANNGSPDVLAADSGKVVLAGWPDNTGYGNRVIIDHGNGYRTLYGHLARVYVVPGQTVGRGSAIGKMGTTGRSTGIHLHFEVINNGSYLNPINVLK